MFFPFASVIQLSAMSKVVQSWGFNSLGYKVNEKDEVCFFYLNLLLFFTFLKQCIVFFLKFINWLLYKNKKTLKHVQKKKNLNSLDTSAWITLTNSFDWKLLLNSSFKVKLLFHRLLKYGVRCADHSVIKNKSVTPQRKK